MEWRIRLGVLASAFIVGGCSLIVDPSDLVFVSDDGGSATDGGPDAEVDSGSPADGGDAGRPDAGPCVETCEGETPLCNPGSGECVQCLSGSDCDDGVLCTIDRCSAAGMCTNDLERQCFTSLSTGATTTCATRSSDQTYCWGSNSHGQLGSTLVTVGEDRSRPVLVNSLTDALSVSVQERHACAVRATGDVVCWGEGRDGKLGRGSITDSRTPTPVSSVANALGVGAGFYHSCAFSTGGQARCWGANRAGQLGDGTMDDRFEPVDVLGSLSFTGLSAGLVHTCGVADGGDIWCWGDNLLGQLGDGTDASATRPAQVVGLSDAQHVSAGVFHSCAIVGSGSVVCWGGNAEGQLGDGTTSDANEPVVVEGLPAVVAVEAGALHTCALTGEGDVYCWGNNETGQLGLGTTSRRETTPNLVPGLSGVSLVDAGGGHSCAQVGFTEIFCWGDNAAGQLGDNSTEMRTSPVAARL